MSLAEQIYQTVKRLPDSVAQEALIAIEKAKYWKAICRVKY